MGMKRKGGASTVRKSAMSSLMNHDEGPYAKLDWPSKKSMLTDKPSQADGKAVKRQTFIKVMSDHKQPRRTRANEDAS